MKRIILSLPPADSLKRRRRVGIRLTDSQWEDLCKLASKRKGEAPQNTAEIIVTEYLESAKREGVI